MRYARVVVFGVGAALLPFFVVAFFTWARDGRAAGLEELLGRGELFPGATLLGAQALATSYGVPMPMRRGSWIAAVGMSWFLLGIASAGYLVPHAIAGGYEPRLAGASLVTLTFAVVAGLIAVHVSGKV
jgi:hypothetical protein